MISAKTIILSVAVSTMPHPLWNITPRTVVLPKIVGSSIVMTSPHFIACWQHVPVVLYEIAGLPTGIASFHIIV